MSPRLHFSRGIEVLIKKAAVDPDFRQLLLEQRAEAARVIDLQLTPAEVKMLAAIPAELLDKVIAQTHVPSWSRRIFMGTAAAAMLAALGVGVEMNYGYRSLGHQPPRRTFFDNVFGDSPDQDPTIDPGNMNEPAVPHSLGHTSEYPPYYDIMSKGHTADRPAPPLSTPTPNPTPQPALTPAPPSQDLPTTPTASAAERKPIER